MAGGTENGVAEVWDRVKAWPVADRLALASRILQSLEREQPRPAVPTPPHSRRTVMDLLGAWATDQPPPTDDEVERIIDEAVMRKHG